MLLTIKSAYGIKKGDEKTVTYPLSESHVEFLMKVMQLPTEVQNVQKQCFLIFRKNVQMQCRGRHKSSYLILETLVL